MDRELGPDDMPGRNCKAPPPPLQLLKWCLEVFPMRGGGAITLQLYFIFPMTGSGAQGGSRLRLAIPRPCRRMGLAKFPPKEGQEFLFPLLGSWHMTSHLSPQINNSHSLSHRLAKTDLLYINCDISDIGAISVLHSKVFLGCEYKFYCMCSSI